MATSQKKARGDRKDAVRVRNLDPMHALMPYLMLDRTDNEAVLNDDIDLTAVTAFLDKKNAADPAFKYTIFHVVLAALAKTVVLRPRMHRFMQGHRLYQRRDISFCFDAKRKFADEAEEAIILLKVDPEDERSPIEQVYQKVKKELTFIRKDEGTDDTTKVLEVLRKFPRPILRGIVKLLFWMEYHGILPASLEQVDPYHTTCFISNLGSIKMNASYHHLINWGTNSFFAIVGEKKWKPVFEKDGSYEMKEMLPVSFTIDERIADGFYFIQSLKVFRAIMQNPDILDLPIDTPLQDEVKS